MHTYYASTLGTFSISAHGRPLSHLSLKERALIAYLVTNKPNAYRREFLADLLWPSVSEELARHSLSQALYSIRRVATGLLVADRKTLMATARTDNDAIREALEASKPVEAALLIRGPFLDDLNVRDAPEFDDWREAMGHSLMLQWERAITRLLTVAGDSSVPELIARLPPRVLVLMPSLSGVCSESRGIHEPDVPQRLRSGYDGTDVPWVGRQSQLHELQHHFSQAMSGLPQFALIKAPPGFGKTRLIREFERLNNRSNSIILRASCYEAEQAIPFGPMTQALSESLEKQLLAGLDPIWLGSLRQLIPHISTESPPNLSASASQSRFFEAVLQLVNHLNGVGPVVLLIDDLQWCDHSTRALLSYLYNRARGIRLFVLGAVRARPQSTKAQPWDVWHQLDLAEFTRKELSKLTQIAFERAGRQPTLTVERLTRLTAGHPYLVSEIVRVATADEEGTSTSDYASSSIDSFLNAMLSGLPIRCQRLVAVMAVMRRPAKLDLIRLVARRKDISEPLNVLLSRGVIEMGQGKVRFRHDLAREAAYARIPLLTKLDIHRRVAEAIIRTAGSFGEAATHYYRARMRLHAYRYAIFAARDSDNRSAVHECAHYLRLALSAKPERATRLRAMLAQRLARVRRLDEARSALAPTLADHNLPKGTRLRLTIFDYEMAYTSGGITGATLRGELNALLESFSADDNSQELHRVIRLQLRSAINDGAREIVKESIDKLIALTKAQAGTRTQIESLALAAKAQSVTSSSRQAQALAAPLHMSCSGIESHELRIFVLTVLGGLSYDCGDVVRADAIHQRALAEIKQVGAVSIWPVVALHTHMILVEQGKLDDAHVIAQEIEARTSDMDTPEIRGVLCANMAAMHYELSQLPEAQAFVERGLQYSDQYDSVWLKLALLGTKGLVALDNGHLRSALEIAEYVRTKIDSHGIRILDMSTAETLIARTLCLMNKRDEAVDRLTRAIQDYGDRDMLCRLKLQLELARCLRLTDRKKARETAKDIYETARMINALPLAERADALLQRI